MISRWLAVGMLMVASTANAQETKDFFACIDPSRLAPRTVTYAVAGTSVPYMDIEIVETVKNADQQMFRITRRRLRDKNVTAEQIMHVDARTLAPVSYLHRSPSRPDALADLVVQRSSDGALQLTGKTYGGQPVAVPTNGEPVLFGTSAVAMLLAAVDWERCVSVSGLQLSSEDQLLRRGMLITKAADSVFVLNGKTIPVHKLEVTSETFKWSMFVTKSAPFVVAKHMSTLGSRIELTSIRI